MSQPIFAAIAIAAVATFISHDIHAAPIASNPNQGYLSDVPISSTALSLETAEKLLIERNLSLVGSRFGVDAARAQRLVASAFPSPQITFGNTSAQFNETQRSSFDGFRGIGPQNNFSAGLNMVVERGGKRALRTRVADESISVAEAQVLDALRVQIFALRQAFLAALQAKSNFNVATSNIESLDRTENLLRRQLRNGAIPEGELLRFQASRIQFDADVSTTSQSYGQAISQLASLLAMTLAAPSERSLRSNQSGGVVQPDGGASNATERSSQAPRLPSMGLDVTGLLSATRSLPISHAELSSSIQNRADVIAASRQASAAAANRLLAEAGRSRDVTFSLNFNRSRMAQNIPQTAGSAVYANDQIGVSASVPIFTQSIVNGNIGLAGAQHSQAEANARQISIQAQSEFASAWENFQQARSLLALYNTRTIRTAEAAYQSTERAYLAGGRTLLDVMDALRTLNATKVATNNARYAYLISLANLENSTGASGILPKI